jgi:hypothetical protein
LPGQQERDREQAEGQHDETSSTARLGRHGAGNVGRLLTRGKIAIG